MNFDKIKAAFGDVVAQDREITRKIEAAGEKIRTLEKSPLPKSDYLAHGLASIDQMAEGYLSQLQVQANNDQQRDPLDFAEPGLFFGFCPGGMVNVRIVQPAALCFLAGPLVKEQYKKAVDRLDWPKDCGPALAERTKQIATLKAEIASLYEQQIELRRLAAESGLALGLLTEDPTTLTKAQIGARAKLAADEAKGKAMMYSGV